MAEPTKLRLASALEEIGENALARRARLGEFDDFESPLAFPKRALVTALNLASITNRKARQVAKRVQDGEFDNTREEANAWAATPEGMKAMEAMIDLFEDR